MSKYTRRQIKEYLGWVFDLGQISLEWRIDRDGERHLFPMQKGEHSGKVLRPGGKFCHGVEIRADLMRAIESLAPSYKECWKQVCNWLQNHYDDYDAVQMNGLPLKISELQKAILNWYILPYYVLPETELELVDSRVRNKALTMMMRFLNG